MLHGCDLIVDFWQSLHDESCSSFSTLQDYFLAQDFLVWGDKDFLMTARCFNVYPKDSDLEVLDDSTYWFTSLQLMLTQPSIPNNWGGDCWVIEQLVFIYGCVALGRPIGFNPLLGFWSLPYIYEIYLLGLGMRVHNVAVIERMLGVVLHHHIFCTPSIWFINGNIVCLLSIVYVIFRTINTVIDYHFMSRPILELFWTHNWYQSGGSLIW